MGGEGLDPGQVLNIYSVGELRLFTETFQVGGLI
jgi:hypothetical protein